MAPQFKLSEPTGWAVYTLMLLLFLLVRQTCFLLSKNKRPGFTALEVEFTHPAVHHAHVFGAVNFFV